MVNSESNDPPPMRQVPISELETAIDDAFEWDQEDFDRADFVWTGPDEAPFDFNKPAQHQPVARQVAPSGYLDDELADPLRHPETGQQSLIELLFNVEPPDLTDPRQAVRIAQFALCLTAVVLLNIVVLLLNL